MIPARGLTDMTNEFGILVEVRGVKQRFPLKKKIQGKYERGIVERCTGMARAIILLVRWPHTLALMVVKFGVSFKGHLTKKNMGI